MARLGLLVALAAVLLLGAVSRVRRTEQPPPETNPPHERSDEAPAKALAQALRQCDGTTDHHQVAAYLEALRAMGPRAASAADTLVQFLPERSPLYKDRDKSDALRLRSFLLVTLADVGVPRTALPFIVESLAASNMAHPFAAAARAAGARGPDAGVCIPFLLRALDPAFHDELITLDRYDAVPDAEQTTGRLEAIRALGRMGPAARAAVPLLTAIAEGDAARGDRAVVGEAQKALKAIRRG
jgi:hypothetical protein